MKTRLDLAKHFNDKGFKKGAEIGVANGYFSEELCKAIPNVELYCIDPWVPYSSNSRGGGPSLHTHNYLKTQERLKNHNATLIRQFSIEASLQFEDDSLDFVYIDGNHDFDYVMEDIIAWTRKVKKGGIVAGHDYYHFTDSGVIEAVNKFTEFHKYNLNLTQQNNDAYSDNRRPSWWFVKA